MSATEASEAAAPRQCYAERLAQRSELVRRLDRRCRWLSHSRLAVFAAFALLCWFAFGTRVAPPYWAAVALAGFAALAVVHDRTLRRLSAARLAAAHYERGISRIDGSWTNSGSQGDAVRPLDHDYADDLDLFGEGSLFELISTSRTPLGERSLAAWLCAPAAPDIVRARQSAVADLRPRLDLREDLASLTGDVGTRLDADNLVTWAEHETRPAATLFRAALAVIAAATVASLVAWVRGAPPGFFVGFALLVLGLSWALRGRCKRAVAGLDGAARAFGLLPRVLARLERESFDDPLLSRLRGELVASTHSASNEIASLRRLTDLHDAMRNQFFMPIGALLLWAPQFSLAIEAWRARNGPRVSSWLAAVAELEALVSLSTYAYEHPAAVFPTIVPDSEGPVFDARGLGHPLIPESQRVANDLCLSPGEAVCIVSGSNMSGKSTLLRSVGVSVAMAQAGAPVCADSLRISPLALGASLRIVDSLQTGTSHFYAELVRLRRIADLAELAGSRNASGEATPPDGAVTSSGDGTEHGARPLLFLLDEVLHGTNSHDRRIGADAVVRSLLARGSIGLVTTHDLALAKIADELAPDVRNVHFEDRLVEGRLEFDYTLREGVVTRSNALDLMREIGLDV